MKFTERVHKTEVKDREAAVFWLGQAGFLIKTADGRLTAIGGGPGLQAADASGMRSSGA